MTIRVLAAVALGACAALAQQQPEPGTAGAPLARFRNLAGTFQLDLPADWRQLAPNEARAIGEHAGAPARLTFAQPHRAYAVGPVDRWLAGDFTGPWLYVVESEDAFHLPDDFAAVLAASWTKEGEASGDRHTLADVRRTAVGTQGVDAIVATRLSVPAGARPATQSLDVHCPAGRGQLGLSFCAAPERFQALEPAFRAWLATLTFARPPRPAASLGDRLWGPALTSIAVCLGLWLLWKHTRRR
jgi:hypothetical protein